MCQLPLRDGACPLPSLHTQGYLQLAVGYLTPVWPVQQRHPHHLRIYRGFPISGPGEAACPATDRAEPRTYQGTCGTYC